MQADAGGHEDGPPLPQQQPRHREVGVPSRVGASAGMSPAQTHQPFSLSVPHPNLSNNAPCPLPPRAPDFPAMLERRGRSLPIPAPTNQSLTSGGRTCEGTAPPGTEAASLPQEGASVLPVPPLKI